MKERRKGKGSFSAKIGLFQPGRLKVETFGILDWIFQVQPKVKIFDILTKKKSARYQTGRFFSFPSPGTVPGVFTCLTRENKLKNFNFRKKFGPIGPSEGEDRAAQSERSKNRRLSKAAIFGLRAWFGTRPSRPEPSEADIPRERHGRLC